MNVEKQNLIKGALICLLGCFCLAVMSACVKALPPTVSTLTVIFFQNFICLLLITPSILVHGFKTLKTEYPLLQVTRAMSGLFSFFALFFAIRYIPLVDGILLQGAGPLWLPFVIWIWLKRKVPRHAWLGIIIGFIGIALILKPGVEIFDLASMAALLSGVFMAISLASVRLLTYTEPTHRILFYYFLIGTCLTWPCILITWTPLTGKALLLLISIGILMYLGQGLLTYSFRFAKASVLAPISYSTILFSGILGWIFWDYLPNWVSFLGMTLVIFGSVLTILYERRSLKILEKGVLK